MKLLKIIEDLEARLSRRVEKNLLNLQPGDVLATYANVDVRMQRVRFKPGIPIGFGLGAFREVIQVLLRPGASKLTQELTRKDIT